METRLDVIERAALLAEDLGYEVFAVPEGWGVDATVVLTHLAARTSRIKLATTILSIWGRSAATLAMGAATLHELSNGRDILGLGASTPNLAEGLHDVAFERPISKLRDTTVTVRALLSGQRAVLQGTTGSRPLKLNFGPSNVPIWHGTTGDRAVRVTAELADGWMLSWAARDGIGAKAAQLAEHRKQAGIRDDPLVVFAGPIVQVDEDAEAARRAVGNIIAWYMCTMGELHPRFVSSQGFEPEVKAVQAANPGIKFGQGVIPPQAEALLEQFGVTGPPADVRRQLDAWDEVVDILSIGLPAGGNWSDIEATLRAAAP